MQNYMNTLKKVENKYLRKIYSGYNDLNAFLMGTP